MKQITFTLLLLSVFGMMSCRKDKNEPDIKQYDQIQIQNYITANGLTAMQKDTTGGDTTGMYYQIILPPKGSAMDYSSKIAFVYSLRTLDGKYVSSDTINNHFEDYLGHISTDKLPLGLQTGLHNLLKNRGGSIRLLIPSHLAYGINGYGSGSSQTANTKIPGNASLDYYVRVIGDVPNIEDQKTYDDMVIRNYLSANGLTGYLRSATGLYYKVLAPGSGLTPITSSSVCTATYTGQLLNAYIFDGSHNGTNTLSFSLTDFATPGNVEGLTGQVAGTKISLIMPSALGYADVAQTGIPVNSCLRFTWQILTVTQ